MLPITDKLRDLRGKRLHFVGIGGCGMSGLARMARHAGAICTGSDHSASPTVRSLLQDGFEVALEQTAKSVPADCDLLVVSAAIKPDHPEVTEAQHRRIAIIKYAQMLGLLMSGKTGIAIAGTHGKSTTTAMLSHMLLHCDLDPSFILGATCDQIGGGSHVGNSQLLIAEACEFDRSFHNLCPTHGIILNVEEDHLDIYSSLDEIVEAFAIFARKLPKAADGGTLLINHEMPCRLAIAAKLECDVETIGFAPQADWHVELSGSGVCLFHRDRIVADWANPIPGEHMAYNGAVAAVTAHRLGAPWSGICEAINGFRGLDRRMQFLGERRLPNHPGVAVSVVDDYGHHPTEIDTTLRALRRHYNPQRLICVFQPHQHSRTRFLLDQFAVSFSGADVVIVPHIYFVRDSEAERHAVQAGDLVDRLRQRGKKAMHLYPFEAIVEQLEVISQPGDMLVTMGAGDVWKIARDFLSGGRPGSVAIE